MRSASSIQQWRSRADAPSPAFLRFVLLSMLLHATIVILFGTSHGIGAGRAEGALDVLDVTLRRQPAMPDAALRTAPDTEPAARRALSPRADEHPVRAAPPRNEAPAPIEPAKTRELLPIEPPLPSPQRAVEPETMPPPIPMQAIEPLPRIDSHPVLEMDKSPIPPLTAAPPTPPPIERLAPPPTPPPLAAPMELAPRVAPLIPAAPIERLAAPPLPRELAAPVELAPPREAPPLPAPLDHLAVPRIENELAPVPSLVAPSPSAAPAAQPPRLRLGAPAADEDLFKPRRDAAAPGESGGPHIDMEAARRRAREIASEATSARGILPALPPPPERKSKESTALEKAVKPDCRTAYAGMGLLAVPVLVASTIGDGGCRW